LKNPQKEIPKMFKHLSEEVPEEAHVRREIRDLQTEEKNSNNQSACFFLKVSKQLSPLVSQQFDKLSRNGSHNCVVSALHVTSVKPVPGFEIVGKRTKRR